MNVMVSISIEDSPTDSCHHRFAGRMALLIKWLVEIGDAVNRSGKGKIQVDYKGDEITKSFLQIEEGGSE
jgi:hypothetical protein